MEQMKNQALIADLKAALLSAQEGQTVQAGYMIRSACGAIDGVLRSMDLDNSVAFALHEIEKLERVVRQLSPQSTAA